MNNDIRKVRHESAIQLLKACESADRQNLRDYFAAAALQGMLAHCLDYAHGPKRSALHAYQFADAMLEIRNNKPEEK